MNVTQSTLQRSFTIEHKGKKYYVDYLNSDGQILETNRNYWGVYDEEGEEVNIYIFKNSTRKEKEQAYKDLLLAKRLIKICIKHFDDYQPDINIV